MDEAHFRLSRIGNKVFYFLKAIFIPIYEAPFTIAIEPPTLSFKASNPLVFAKLRHFIKTVYTKCVCIAKY